MLLHLVPIRDKGKKVSIAIFRQKLNNFLKRGYYAFNKNIAHTMMHLLVRRCYIGSQGQNRTVHTNLIMSCLETTCKFLRISGL